MITPVMGIVRTNLIAVALVAFAFAPYGASTFASDRASTFAPSALRRGEPVPLSLKDLQNFTYSLGDHSSVEGGKVPLAGGTWTDPADGSRFTLHPIHALGDLDGDGRGDAIAILVESTVGTGTFSYLFAVGSGNDGPVQLGDPEWLGDRTVVQRLSIDRKGIVTIRYLTHADGDPACCPTLKIEDRYRLEGGRLVGILK